MFVKVCGLSTPESVREAVDAGADAVGFVLTASPRVVSPSQAASLLAGVPDSVSPIGVFRDEPVTDAIAIARAAGLEWIQLHGARSRTDVETVHDAGMKLVRAITMGASPDEFEDWGEDLLLIDAAVPGSGESWDYASVAALPVLPRDGFHGSWSSSCTCRALWMTRPSTRRRRPQSLHVHT